MERGTLKLSRDREGADERPEIKAVRAALQAESLESLGRSSLTGRGAVRELEERFASSLGMRFALAVSSGTAALHTALLACGVGPGDEVIVSAYDWSAATAVVLQQRAQPIFADIHPETYTLDPASVATRLTDHTRAIIVTHLFGQPAEMEGLTAVARQSGLVVIEDAAQALGARYRGRPVGSLGDLGCFSLGPGKILCAGEGGMLATHEEALYAQALRWSQHPLRQSQDLLEVNPFALNYRLHPLAAVCALAQWEDLPRRLATRRAYCEGLSHELEAWPGIRPPAVTEGGGHAWHRYSPTFVPEEAEGLTREALIQRLLAEGVPACPGYIRVPLPHQLWGPEEAETCPVAARRCREQELGMDLRF